MANILKDKEIRDYPKEILDISTPEMALDYLLTQNKKYVESLTNSGNISLKRRETTFENGQKPYAIVVTCCDSRVVPEHIFLAGVGEIFSIRTAGNVVSEFDLGSIEYAAKYLGVNIILVMGHTTCAVVDAAISNKSKGHVTFIVNEIKKAIGKEKNHEHAEKLNVEHTVIKIKKSDIISKLENKHKIKVIGSIYDTKSGLVSII